MPSQASTYVAQVPLVCCLAGMAEGNPIVGLLPIAVRQVVGIIVPAMLLCRRQDGSVHFYF